MGGNRTVRAVAPAKVNLALRVGAQRADGFHPLNTIFEAMNISEIVTAKDADSLSLEFDASTGLGGDLPTDSSNLAIRAGLALQEKFGVRAGAHLVIEKHIPVAGGMAGGSADAAAALVALNELWGIEASAEELAELAIGLGSDVPFALFGGVARGLSRGEDLEPIVAGAEHGFVMLTNPRGLSTPAVFREFDRMGVASGGEPADTDDLRAAIQGNDLEAVGQLLMNDLEAPAFSLRPDLAETVGQLRNQMRTHGGYQGVILSGSGPTIAVLCRPSDAADLARELQREYPELTALAATGPVPGTHLI